MKKTILLSAILMGLLYACQLSTVENGQLYIRGRLFLTDTVFQNIKNEPLAGKTIFLGQGTDTVNYLYSTKSDSTGYFVFQLASPTGNYHLQYQDTLKGVFYSAYLKVKNNQSALMVASIDGTKQNGFYVYCRDSQGGYIPGAMVSIYNSPTLADLNDPSGAFKTIIAGASGLAATVNLPILSPGQYYYLNATKILINRKDTLVRIAKRIIVKSKGITPVDSLTLK